MKTKKWLALILAGVAVCGMMGCGSGKKATETSDQSATEIDGTIQLVEGKWEDVYFNEEYKEEGMKTVKGVEAPPQMIILPSIQRQAEGCSYLKSGRIVPMIICLMFRKKIR